MVVLVKNITVIMSPRSLSTVNHNSSQLILSRLCFVLAFVNVCDFALELC